MRILTFPLLALAAAVFITGCAGPEQKLGRGLSNSTEIARMGEMRRSVEQTAVFDSPNQAYTTGVVRGFDRTMARTGIGIYEVITFPFPPYHPLATRYLSPGATGPDSYKPGVIDDPLFDTDTFTGFSSGDAAPWMPGSRFSVFSN